MIANNIFYYRKAAHHSVFPGAHAGEIAGNGLLFKQHRPLIAAPDPRRIDLRASVLDPFAHFRVKAFQQQSRLDVFLLADLSASMAYQGQFNKARTVADCLLSVAQSAHATGDRFGFVGCAQTIEPRLLISPASLQQSRATEIAELLHTTPLTGRAESLLQAANYLPNRSALVFLLSDWYMPMAMMQQLMQKLHQHTTVPLVLWDKQESHDLPAWGMLKFADPEQGKTRTLWMRPVLREKIQTAFAQRKQQLRQCFRRFGSEPLFIEQGYRAESISHYFLKHAG